MCHRLCTSTESSVSIFKSTFLSSPGGHRLAGNNNENEIENTRGWNEFPSQIVWAYPTGIERGAGDLLLVHAEWTWLRLVIMLSGCLPEVFGTLERDPGEEANTQGLWVTLNASGSPRRVSFLCIMLRSHAPRIVRFPKTRCCCSLSSLPIWERLKVTWACRSWTLGLHFTIRVL